MAGITHPGYGWDDPYACYNPAILEPPEDAELLDSWQIYFRVAKKLGITLRACDMFVGNPFEAPELDMDNEPSNDELLEILTKDAVVPFSEVKRHPNGKVFDQARVKIQPRDADCEARLQLADDYIIEQLGVVRSESIQARRGLNEEFPLSYISVRMQNTTCAAGRPKGLLKRPDNPVLMHPSDLEALGLNEGDLVELRSRHGAVQGLVDTDKCLRPGVVSMCHGFGKMPDEDSDPRKDGANVNNLISMTDDNDPYNGQPRMSALPVSVKKVAKETVTL